MIFSPSGIAEPQATNSAYTNEVLNSKLKMNKDNNEKYLVFDAYGTLLQVTAEIPGLNPEQERLSAEIQALWRTKQLEYTWLRSLMGKFEDFNLVTRDALDYACSYYHMEDKSFKAALLSIFEQPAAFEDARLFLKKRKSEGFKTAILSNGELDMLDRSIEIAGIRHLIDHVLSASRVQVFKPAPKVYELATNLFTCDYEDIVFFSSNPWDIAGATHFGFRTVWINRKGLPFEELGVKPHQTVEHFGEVKVG